ncbi:acyl-CoA dehydrogenase family protein [Chloroflexota bacterium]
MDFHFTDDEERFRQEIRRFLASEVPTDFETGIAGEVETEEEWEFSRSITRKLAQRGWLTVAWPREHGGEGSTIKQFILSEEMAYRGAPGLDTYGIQILAPTLIAHGTEEQKRRFLPGIASGETVWCQGYSEPGAGSDLASLSTRAVEDGDSFVINGQKVWTSSGHRADWYYVLVRTNPDAPKHKGLSFLLVDMKTPGITVRPLVTLAGLSSFCEVFFEDVNVPKENIVGEKDNGWVVSMSAMNFERSGVHRLAAGLKNLSRITEFFGEMGRDNSQPSGKYVMVRQKLAEFAVEGMVGRMLAYRVADMHRRGLSPIHEASMSRMYACELQQRVARVGMEVLGLYGQLEVNSKWAKLHGRIEREYLVTIGATIAAGTSEVQRNIIALRGLGLPS